MNEETQTEFVVLRCPACGGMHGVPSAAAAHAPRCPRCGAVLAPLRKADLPTEILSESGPGIVVPHSNGTRQLRRLGRYQVLEMLGQGGMGAVYLAYDTSLRRWIALKTLRSASQATPEECARLRREAEITAKLHHPGIVAVHEVGWQSDQADGEILYFAMDYVRGETLRSRLLRGPRPTRDEALQLTRQVVDALAHAHGLGILHRDVKPENILLSDPQGPYAGRALLTDFGLARQEGSATGLTVDGDVLGTPAYMSPEQAEGDQSRIGPPTDVYAAGVLLYELLSGRLPFSGDNPAAVIARVLLGEPPPLRRVSPDVPRDLEAIVTKCMDRDPARRYASARAMEEDLDRYLHGEAVRALPVTAIYLARRWILRRKARLAFVAGLAAAMLGCAWLIAERWRSRQAPWRQPFQDAFARAEIGPDWLPLHGAWKIHDGALCCDSTADRPVKGAEILIAQRFPGNVRLRYRAEFLPSEATAGDLSALLCVQAHGDAAGYVSGYFLGFGARYGGVNLLRREGRPVQATDSVVPVVGRSYRVTAERVGDQVRLEVVSDQDGTPITALQWTDLSPIDAPDRQHVGLYSWSGHCHFHDVVVEAQESAPRPERSELADVYSAHGDWERAARLYRDSSEELESSPGLLKLKEGLSYARLAAWEALEAGEREAHAARARQILERIRTTKSATSFLRSRAIEGLARLSDGRGDCRVALDGLQSSLRAADDPWDRQSLLFVLRDLGELRAQQRQFAAAADYFAAHASSEALPHAERPYALLDLWRALERAGRWEDILASVREAPPATRPPDQLDYDWARFGAESRALAGLGRWEDLLSLLRKTPAAQGLAHQDDVDRDRWMYEAHALAALGRWSGAQAVETTRRRLALRAPGGHADVASVFLRMGDLEAARRELREARTELGSGAAATPEELDHLAQLWLVAGSARDANLCWRESISRPVVRGRDDRFGRIAAAYVLGEASDEDLGAALSSAKSDPPPSEKLYRAFRARLAGDAAEVRRLLAVERDFPPFERDVARKRLLDEAR